MDMIRIELGCVIRIVSKDVHSVVCTNRQHFSVCAHTNGKDYVIHLYKQTMLLAQVSTGWCRINYKNSPQSVHTLTAKTEAYSTESKDLNTTTGNYTTRQDEHVTQ